MVVSLIQGLAKLQKTQKDVDVLVEEAKIKAVEVEKKVAGADAFAEQVGVEKTKVNLENEAAQVEAEKCGVIAKDVTELQARCEKDLAAAEPLVAQAEAALDTLNKKDLGGSHLTPCSLGHATNMQTCDSSTCIHAGFLPLSMLTPQAEELLCAPSPFQVWACHSACMPCRLGQL